MEAAPHFRTLLQSPLVGGELTPEERYSVANSLLRRFGRDHPEAYRKRDKGPPEVIVEVFHRWCDDLVFRKADLHDLLKEYEQERKRNG